MARRVPSPRRGARLPVLPILFLHDTPRTMFRGSFGSAPRRAEGQSPPASKGDALCRFGEHSTKTPPHARSLPDNQHDRIL